MTKRFACEVTIYNVKQEECPHFLQILIKLITAKDAVMILRERKMGRINDDEGVYFVAIYLNRADVLVHTWPLCSSSSQVIFPLHVYAHSNIRTIVPESRTVFTIYPLAGCHSTTFVKAISSRH